MAGWWWGRVEREKRMCWVSSTPCQRQGLLKTLQPVCLAELCGTAGSWNCMTLSRASVTAWAAPPPLPISPFSSFPPLSSLVNTEMGMIPNLKLPKILLFKHLTPKSFSFPDWVLTPNITCEKPNPKGHYLSDGREIPKMSPIHSPFAQPQFSFSINLPLQIFLLHFVLMLIAAPLAWCCNLNLLVLPPPLLPTAQQSSRRVCTGSQGCPGWIVGGSVQGQGLDWVILGGPFQPRTFCDSLEWGRTGGVPGRGHCCWSLGRPERLLGRNWGQNAPQIRLSVKNSPAKVLRLQVRSWPRQQQELCQILFLLTLWQNLGSV